MKLDPQELAPLLAELAAWQHDTTRGGFISRRFSFSDFAHAFGFMTQVAIVAEKRDHHPEWSNVYNRVDVTLTTHDADGLTMKDIELARYMDEVAAALTP